jgi:hypothetical protein
MYGVPADPETGGAPPLPSEGSDGDQTVDPYFRWPKWSGVERGSPLARRAYSTATSNHASSMLTTPPVSSRPRSPAACCSVSSWMVRSERTGSLKTAGCFDLDSLAAVEVLTTFQLAYDACDVEDRAIRSRRTERPFNLLLSLDPHNLPEVWPSPSRLYLERDVWAAMTPDRTTP